MQKIIMWLVILPIILVFITFTIDLFVPLYISGEFNSICNEYNQILIRDGELNPTEVSELRAKLKAKDIDVIEMDLPTRKEWGDSFTFRVKANYSQSLIKMNLTKESKTHTFEYSRTGVALRGED